MAKSSLQPTIFAGTMKPADDRWCDGCMKSSILTGPLQKLGEWGVTYWGTVTGCLECAKWVFRNRKGEIEEVEVLS